MYADLEFIGHVGNVSDMRQSKNGTDVIDFSLAVSIGYGDYKRTQWVKVTAWDKRASLVSRFVKKGDKVQVVASEFDVEAWQAKDGTIKGQLSVTAASILFLNSKSESKAEPQQVDPFGHLPDDYSIRDQPASPPKPAPLSDEDIPF